MDGAAAAIRDASALPNLLQESPKYKPKLRDVLPSSSNTDVNNGNTQTSSKPRNRNELLYNEDEEEPNLKIDKLIDQRNKEKQEKQLVDAEKAKKENQVKQNSKKTIKQDQSINPQTSTSNSRSNQDQNKRKLSNVDIPNKKPKPSRVTKPYHELLSGVTIVISGIENPERSTIRSQALAMGAKYKADWDNTCTHLICAFTNTPKFRQVKGKGKIVNRVWISDCFTARKRIPWRRYAIDTNDQTQNESEDEIWEDENVTPQRVLIPDDDFDTEDEMERISTSLNNHEGIYDMETDEDTLQMYTSSNSPDLSELFAGKVLYIDKDLSESTTSILVKYIKVHNGLLMEELSDIIEYVIASPKSSDTLKVLCPEAKIVSPEWIWECHNTKKLVSHDCYRL